ncbi:TetR/AcrR family transcriptional regulator [Streptomyces meridianus]|uniref:TetR/AcrR family transcriptional regulator n=1 Tax=Streptomyces meridianus TaxID=2938945 RepID=A0ABT0XC72_9ACTN|nr:TetR/AcrR family transcriptional regulator [Streptomyces meridianus]MCM2580122.1 TetR/AcrR family transcriptional regulator [Streptomyces meridianus]
MDTARAVTAGTKGVPRAEREAQIIAAAVEEFGRHGYAGASMAAIAARVGVTKPLIYQYFGSKDGLHIAALEHVAGLLTPAITRALSPGAATLDVPLAVLEAIFTTLEGRRHAWFVLFDRTLPSDGELRRTARHHRDIIDRLAASGSAELLRARGIDDEVDADALKHLWTGAVSSLVSWWNAHPEESAEDMAGRCARLFAAVVG